MIRTPRTDAFVAMCNARSSVGRHEAMAFARKLESDLDAARALLAMSLAMLKVDGMDHARRIADFLVRTDPPK